MKPQMLAPHRAKSLLMRCVNAAWNYLLFFGLVGFVLTCSFYVFFASVQLSEEDIRAFAPVVFYNAIVLAALFFLIDTIRRKITIERPVEEIQETLTQLMAGNFDARVPVYAFRGKYSRFRDIAESINLLAEELGGVETLRTDFIANVSHELKTPLAAMQNYAVMLQQPELPESQRIEYARAITQGSQRLTSLITNILKLNKLENQQIFPMVSEFDLSEQLVQCLLQFESVWEEKNINIEADIEEEVRIRSDGELLSLVWNNLLSNAFKFTEPGGTVSLKMHSEGRMIIVAVSDTGCGMTPETGTHIFEKFYQGDTSHATRGNGLGLALVKRVIDIMQGEIHVESVYGKGSTFTARIWNREKEFN